MTPTPSPVRFLSGFVFVYFVAQARCLSLLTLWLRNTLHLSGTEAGAFRGDGNTPPNNWAVSGMGYVNNGYDTNPAVPQDFVPESRPVRRASPRKIAIASFVSLFRHV